MLPEENAREAAVVFGLDVYPVGDLREVVALLKAEAPPAPLRVDVGRTARVDADQYPVDFREVRGQMQRQARHRDRHRRADTISC